MTTTTTTTASGQRNDDMATMTTMTTMTTHNKDGVFCVVCCAVLVVCCVWSTHGPLATSKLAFLRYCAYSMNSAKSTICRSEARRAVICSMLHVCCLLFSLPYRRHSNWFSRRNASMLSLRLGSGLRNACLRACCMDECDEAPLIINMSKESEQRQVRSATSVSDSTVAKRAP